MRLKIGSVILIFSLLFMKALLAQNQDKVQSVQVSAEVQREPVSINLKWNDDSLAEGWRIDRKKLNQEKWNQQIADLSKDQTQYEDKNVTAGEGYEYRIKKRRQEEVIGEGYIASGVELPARHFRGRIALVMDDRLKDSLAAEIHQLKQDLTGSGWGVEIFYVSRDQAVQNIKDSIQALKNKYPDSLEAALLLGQVPVPYSGNFVSQEVGTAPDGHQNHGGAWPADVYFTTSNGGWTDLEVTNTKSKFPRNHNEPRDSVFDQSYLQQVRSEVDIMIGRVDLSNLPAFDTSDIALLKRYLRKNHQYRHGEVKIQRKAVVDNNFNTPGGFGQNGFRNFSTLVGKDQVEQGNYQNTLTDSSYLWSYGAGAGSMNSAQGIVSTNDFVNDTFQGVFTMIFGSYFGDFDGKDNLMRSALASKGNLLSASWSGRPHWHYHHMGIGAPLGKAVKQTQNNASIPPSQSTLYKQGSFAGGVHVALMGDPTLTIYPFKTPSQLVASVVKPTDSSTQNFGNVRLNWSQSTSAAGYYVYRYDTSLGRYRVLNDDPVEGTQYLDEEAKMDTHAYMVRGVRLKTSPSGSYYQLSQGVFDTAQEISYSGISKNDESQPLVAYPNPANNHLTVSIPETVGDGRLLLTNIHGKVINKESIPANDGTVQFSVNDYPSGVYLLKFNGAESIQPEKVIIQ